ncbi:hypothetical protein ABT369_49935 [Dactylosporangium sp. NPDC000244]|uniref:hypothetical protein n=1 Tax=Dactylosporangium sp. NPDC000244 TaxID=3154365 RepID=UPI00332E09E2
MMASQTDLAAAIADLCRTRFVNVGRTLNMVEVGFMRGDDEVRLHVQCPFRLVRHSKVLLGSTDYLYPLKAHSDRAVAFDRYETQFDRRAQILTEALGDGLPVREAHLRDDGAFYLATADELRIEVFPAVSGPIECWRLFVKGSDKHYVYPPAADEN